MIKLNGVKIVPTMFPDGTSQVWKLEQSFIDGLSLDDVIKGDCLKEVFCNGKLLIDEKLSDIRERLKKRLNVDQRFNFG